MIKSMTGFGQAKKETEQYSIQVEIRTLNSKSADITLRLPRQFTDKEYEVRHLVSSRLERGKIAVHVEYEKMQSQTPTAKASINQALASHYYQQLSQLATDLQAPATDLLRLALHMPGVIEDKKTEDAKEDYWPEVNACILQALEECITFRATEGNVLKGVLEGYVKTIAANLATIETRDPERIKMVRERIRNHLAEVQKEDTFNSDRFEQEMIYFIEKLDISEEKVRLKNHLEYFLHTLQTEPTPGKKLGFIAQEIGREINTIGSKANDSTVQKNVVEMKEELEKIKEQSLNIL